MTEPIEEAARELAAAAEDSGHFSFVDWNDLGEVTVHLKGRVFRFIADDITGQD